MYDSEKIKEILLETERQTKILDEIDELNSQIMPKRKIIDKNYDYKRRVDKEFNNLTPEEKEKFDSFREDMEKLHRELYDDYRRLESLEEEIYGLKADEYAKRKEFCDDLNKYLDLTNKINELEETSAKLKSYSGYKMVVIKDDLGNDKAIYELASITYQMFVESRKELSQKLMSNYPSVVKGYDEYVEVKKSNHPTPIRSFESEWVSNKARFRDYIVNVLKIEDPLIANKLLKEFDKGLFYNDELTNMLYRLGFSKKLVDDIVYQFGYCRRPDNITKDIVVKDDDPVEYVFSTEPVEEYQEEPVKKTFNFKIKELSNEAKKKLDNNANRITAFALAGAILTGGLTIHTADANRLDPITDGVVYEYNNPDDLIGDEVDITEEAPIYENMYDAVYDNNRETPYYNNDVNRSVMGVVYEKEDGELVIAETLEDADLYEKQGLNKRAVLTGIDGEYEGFYKIENVVKRGITR